MRITFVTSNPGKLKEARARLAPLGHDVVGHAAELVEVQADGLEPVARAKAESLRGTIPAPYFCEDAGLFVTALNGFPGVYSHYAFKTLGCEGLLRLLGPGADRSARFEAVIGFVDPKGALRVFRGESRGSIATGPRGANGFGFDPIFQPEGSGLTFAELGAEAKGAVSHRGKALDALAAHLAREPKV